MCVCNLITRNQNRFDAAILLLGSLAPSKRDGDLPAAHREAATLASQIALTARDDFQPTPNHIARTADLLPKHIPILGIALTHASTHRAKEFKNATATAQENIS